MSKNRKKIVFLAIFLIINLIFIDFVSAEDYNNYSKELLSCGGGMVTGIPSIIPNVVSTIYTIIQVAIPVVLVIFGLLDLVKGIIASKEDEIKKGQSIFIKRLITAALIFFVFAMVKFVISLVADDNTQGILDCAECFINKNCDGESQKFYCVVDGYTVNYDPNSDDDYVQRHNNPEMIRNINIEYEPSNSLECQYVAIEETPYQGSSGGYNVRVYKK